VRRCELRHDTDVKTRKHWLVVARTYVVHIPYAHMHSHLWPIFGNNINKNFCTKWQILRKCANKVIFVDDKFYVTNASFSVSMVALCQTPQSLATKLMQEKGKDEN